MTVSVIVRPCGFGKTIQMADTASIYAPQHPVLYVAPTRRLALQFARLVAERGCRVVRLFGRNEENCQNPEVFVLPLLGKSQLWYCNEVCGFRDSCDYMASRSALHSLRPGTVYVTTYSFLLYNLLPIHLTGNRINAVVIYDEMPTVPLAMSPASFREARTNLVGYLSLARLKKTSLYREIRKDNPQVAYFAIPRLYEGMETYFLTATPVRKLIEIMFSGAELDFDVDGYALNQRVRVFYSFLPHSRFWAPEPGGCGFKKNTEPGLPYFRASVGLSEWRGKRLRAFGSFSPPPYVFLILAALTGADEVVLSDVEVIFDKEFNHQLKMCRSRKIESAVYAFRYDSEIHPIPTEMIAGDLVQLLGRSGQLVDGEENVLFSDIPLTFENHHFRRRYAREVVLGDADTDSLIRSLAMFVAARQIRDLGNYLLRFYPSAFSRKSVIARLATLYQRRIEIINTTLAMLKSAVSLIETTDFSGGSPDEALPF